VFVHRFTSAAIGGRLVAVLGAGQTFNDYSADFFVNVGALTADTAALTFNYCVRQPAAIAAVNQPQQFPVNPSAPGYSSVREAHAQCLQITDTSESQTMGCCHFSLPTIDIG
jgi:hypothetical protein